MPHTRSTASSIWENLSLNPLPYPVLLILALIFIFVGFQGYLSYESAVEATGDNLGWLLLAAPLVLILAVRLLSNFDNPPESFFRRLPPWDGTRRRSFWSSSEGSSPWGVAALIVLLLVLMQYQSTFLDSWFI